MPKQTRFTHPPSPLSAISQSYKHQPLSYCGPTHPQPYDTIMTASPSSRSNVAFLFSFSPPSLISNFSLCYICHCSHQGHGIITPANELLSKKMHYVLKLRIYCRLCLHKYALKARCFLKNI